MKDLLEIADKQMKIGIFLMVILSCVCVYSTISVKNSVDELNSNINNAKLEATLLYPMNVINYGLNEASSTEEVLNLIKKWHDDEWGAQIGALQTVCDTSPESLLAIMTAKDQVEVCRLVK